MICTLLTFLVLDLKIEWLWDCNFPQCFDMVWNRPLIQDLTSRGIWLKRSAIGRTKAIHWGSINSPFIFCYDMVEDEKEEADFQYQTSPLSCLTMEAEIAAVGIAISTWHSDPLQTHFAADFESGGLVERQADWWGNRNSNQKLFFLCTECVMKTIGV